MVDIDKLLLLAYAIALPMFFIASASAFSFADLVVRRLGLDSLILSALAATVPLIIVVVGLKVLSTFLPIPGVHMGIALVAGGIAGRFWADRKAIGQ